tara:strand:+ start:45 stop:1337 length:1293 start_codon:yes stop_codon:yes gene_type:complete
LIKQFCYKKTFLIFLILFSCSYFEEEEIKLEGKRESIFLSDEKKLKKSFSKIILPDPKLIKDWPQTNQNNSNLLFHFLSGKKLKKKWKANVGKGESSREPYIGIPIIYNELIFTVDNNYNVQSRNYITGKLVWSKQLREESEEELSFIGGLVAKNNSLIISTGLGNLYSLDHKNGKLIWKKNLRAQVSSPPTISNEKVFTISDDNQLFVNELSSGDIIWTHTGNLENVSIMGGVTPAIKDGLVFVTYSSGEIFALNENNGSVQWYENLTLSNVLNEGLITDIQSPPVIVDENIFVSSASGVFVSMKVIDGKRNWELNFSTLNPISVSGDYIFLVDTDNKLYCINKNNGEIFWVVQLKKNHNKELINWVGPILSSHRLLLASSHGSILALSPYTGEILSLIKEKESFTIPPIQAGKMIYLVSKEGNLLSFE